MYSLKQRHSIDIEMQEELYAPHVDSYPYFILSSNFFFLLLRMD